MQELFFNYMASRNIEGWNFRDIPLTKMKTELIEESLNPVIHFIFDKMNKNDDENITSTAKYLFEE